MLTIEINKTVNCRLPRLLISKARKVLETELKIKGKVNVSLAFVSSATIKRWNNIYRKKNQVTDVLSFENKDDLKKSGELGEILICCQQAKKQATNYGEAVSTEIIRLFVHGFLHLCGFDHIKKPEAEKMFTREKNIMAKLKLPYD
jgi:probable rRNA maturation factor